MKKSALFLALGPVLLCSTVLAWTGDPNWGPATRTSIIAKAAEMMDSTWTAPRDFTNFDGPRGRKYYAGVTYTGELYSNSSHQDWREFYNAVTTTPGGNTNYGNNCGKSVNICWQLPSFFSIVDILQKLGGPYFYALGEFGDAPYVSLLPGDALIQSGHIFLFDHYNADGTVEVIEQIPPAPHRRIRSWSSFQSLRPIRRTLLQGGIALNQGVQATSNVAVYANASSSAVSIGTAQIAAQGTVVDGPATVDQYRWWKVKFDQIANPGWVNEGFLRKLATQNLTCSEADATPPNGKIAINSGAIYSNSEAVMLSLSCADGGSGCASMRFSEDNVAWSPWEPFSQTKNWVLQDGHGPKNVYVRFGDACGNVSSTASGTILLQASTPDLVVSSLVAPLAASTGSTINVTETVKNIGAGGANISPISFFISSDSTLTSGDTLLASKSIPALGGGANFVGTASVTVPSNLSPGIFKLFARANTETAIDDCNYMNPCGSMIEGSRNNNSRSVSVTVGPDLFVSSLGVSSSEGSIRITDTIKNVGSDLAGASKTNFYLSSNTVLDSADVSLGSRSVPNLYAGTSSTSTYSASVPPGTAAGTYYVIAKANASGSAIEASASNNIKSKGIVIP